MHSDLENLCGQLAAIVGDGHVAAGVANTAAFAVDGILPELIVRPGTQEEVSQVVAACAKAGAAMIPWGGGTAMGLGNAPARAQVVLHLERLDRLRQQGLLKEDEYQALKEQVIRKATQKP